MMRKNTRLLLLSLICLFSTLVAHATEVRFQTNIGNIDIELYDEDAPNTVQNFLNYVNRGDYDDTVVHRLYLFRGISIVQGGGYRYNGSGNFSTVETDGPIAIEAGVSNVEGTIAMARNNSPNSATNQWFFNLEDNTNLDPSNTFAGYSVFGKVIRGNDVLKLLGSLNSFNISSNLDTVTSDFPTYQYYGGVVGLNNVVTIERAFVLSEEFQVNAGLSGAWFNPATDGQGIYLEVLPDIGQVIMAWFTYDTTDPDLDAPSEVGYAGGRWVTAIGAFDGNEFNGTVYQVDNGLFENSAATVSNTVVGTVNLVFNSCAQLVMSYSLYDGLLNGSSNLQRIAASNIPLCEQLASENNPGIAVQ